MTESIFGKISRIITSAEEVSGGLRFQVSGVGSKGEALAIYSLLCGASVNLIRTSDPSLVSVLDERMLGTDMLTQGLTMHDEASGTMEFELPATAKFQLQQCMDGIQDHFFGEPSFASDNLVNFEDGNGPQKVKIFQFRDTTNTVGDQAITMLSFYSLKGITEYHGHEGSCATILTSDPPILIVKAKDFEKVKEIEKPSKGMPPVGAGSPN